VLVMVGARTATRRSSRAGGFTIVEMMVAIAILAVITALAAPGMGSFMADQRAKALSRELVSDLLVARSEALKRNAPVVVSPAESSWAAGWTVSANDQTLASRPPSAGRFTFDGAPAAITFNRFGRLTAPAEGVRMTVRPVDGSGSAERCVELDLSGRARARKGACA
jgi:type IV fimbrial biogenesis protein FimT